ncbi:MAG TPA: DUF6178 family protein, partial [Myxococcota bacterium]|nr:DUF6178 family protein [Myxococcota bacterium]
PLSPDATVVNLSRFRADVSRALTRRGKNLLEAHNLPEQVAALPPLEAYLIVKELGVDEATPLLQHMTREQVQTCVDLDCWDGDDFSAVECDAWLAAFAQEGPESLARAFFGLDEELQVLFLAASVTVFDLRSEEEPVIPPERAHMNTQDGFFTLVATAEEREVEPFVLIEALYRQSIEEVFRMLTAAKWETPTALGEEAFRFRSGRLEDLGFPSPEVAAKLFAPPPKVTPACVPGVPGAVSLPALYASAMTQGCLFTRAMGRIGAAAVLERLEGELVHLVNAAVVAYGESPRDLAHLTEISTRVRDTLSLGLEAVLSPDAPLPFTDGEDAAEKAAAVLGTWPLLHVFQRGAAEVRPVHGAARALASDPVVAAWLNVTLATDDDPERLDRAFLRALVLPRPLWSGFDPLRPEMTRAWASKKDIAATRARFDTLAARLV